MLQASTPFCVTNAVCCSFAISYIWCWWQLADGLCDVHCVLMLTFEVIDTLAQKRLKRGLFPSRQDMSFFIARADMTMLGEHSRHFLIN